MQRIVVVLVVVLSLIACVKAIEAESFWTKQTIAKTEELTKSIGGLNLGYNVTYNMKPPFYNGSMPLQFKTYVKNIGGGMMGHSAIMLMHDFSEWRNIFIYTGTMSMLQGMPEGAIAVDNNSNRVMAECKVLKMLNIKKQLSGFQLAEIHYNKGGKTIFISTFEVDFPKGFKTKEIASQGKKEKEYFFIWPSGF